MELIDGRAVGLKSRAISPKTTSLYGVLKKDDTLYYPVYSTSDGKLLRYKTRTVKDSELVPGAHGWYGNGSLTHGNFFGTHVKGGSNLLITTGETDTLSFAEVLDHSKFTIWGLTKGEQSLVKSIETLGEALNRFKLVYIAMDSDQAGQDALNAALERLPVSKVRVVRYPTGIKDANELLLKYGSSSLKDAVNSAQHSASDSVDTGDGLFELLTSKTDNLDADDLLTTGYDWLDHLLGGWLPGHVYTLAADTGVGKSTTAMEWAVVYALKHGRKVLLASLEMSNRDIARKLVGVLLGIHTMSPRELIKDERYQDAARWVSDHFVLVKKKGFLTVPELQDMVRSARLYDAHFFLLDHLTAASTGPDGLSWSGLDARAQALQAVTAEEGVVTLSISHISRRQGDDGDGKEPPTLSQMRGGNGLAQNTSWLGGVFAPDGKDDDLRGIKVLKTHRAEIGHWGEAFFTRLTQEEIDAKRDTKRANAQRDNGNVTVETRAQSDRTVPETDIELREDDNKVPVHEAEAVHTRPDGDQHRATDRDRTSHNRNRRRRSNRSQGKANDGGQSKDESSPDITTPRMPGSNGVRKPGPADK